MHDQGSIYPSAPSALPLRFRKSTSAIKISRSGLSGLRSRKRSMPPWQIVPSLVFRAFKSGFTVDQSVYIAIIRESTSR